MNLAKIVFTLCCFFMFGLHAEAASPEMGKLFNKKQGQLIPQQPNKELPLDKKTSKELCPDRTLSKGSVEGAFLGVGCGDMCYGSVRLDSGEIFSFLISEDEATKFFGEGTGQRVALDFERHEFWNEYGGECSRYEVGTGGKAIQAPSALGVLNTYKTADEGLDGTLKLTRYLATPMFMDIAIDTVNQANGHTCDVVGRCIELNGIIFCPANPLDELEEEYCENKDCMIKIRVIGKDLEIFEAPSSHVNCGLNGSILGKYTLQQ